MSPTNLESLLSSLNPYCSQKSVSSIPASSVEILAELGDLLRDEDTRTNIRVVSFVPSFIGLVNTCLSDWASMQIHDNEKKQECTEIDRIVLEVLRVVCNLVADNPPNRETCLNDEQFLCNVKECFELESAPNKVTDRLVICLRNIVNDNEAALPYFVELIESLVKYLEVKMSTSEVDELELLLDLLSDLIQSPDVQKRLTSDDFQLFIKVFRKIIAEKTTLDGEVLDEMLSSTTNLIYLSSDFQDFQEILNYQSEVFACMKQLSSVDAAKMKNLTKIYRRLFATSGNLSSNPQNAKERDLDFCIERIILSENPYSSAAAAIVLGNYISDQNTREKLRSKLPQGFLSSFFAGIKSYNDVIQYQSIHLLNNLLTSNENMLKEVTAPENWFIIKTYSKTLMDNKSYYKEVLMINFKFIKKLIRLSDTDNLLMILNDQEFLSLFQDQINDESIGSEIEVIYCNLIENIISKVPFNDGGLPEVLGILSSNLFKLGARISVDQLFEKIKVIGLLLSQNPDSVGKNIANKENLQNLCNFIISLNEKVLQIDENQKQPGFKALLNNSKFVAAKLYELVESNDIERKDELIATCKAIISFE